MNRSSCVLQDLKANESRLRDINKVASELESEGLMAEEAAVVQAQVRPHSTPPHIRLYSAQCTSRHIYHRDALQCPVLQRTHLP